MDIETRRKKQQALMVNAVERKVRSRAKQIYESQGEAAGRDLENWFQAEAEVLDNTVVAQLYRRVKNAASTKASCESAERETDERSPCETGV